MSSVKTSLRLMAFGFFFYFLIAPWASAQQMSAKIVADSEANKTIKFL